MDASLPIVTRTVGGSAVATLAVAPGAASGSSAVIVFLVAGRQFGLPAIDVLEIVPALTLLPVPEAPGAIEGLAKIRGAIVPVLDARKRLGLPTRPMEPTDHLVLAQLGGRVVGLHVDRVLGFASRRVDAVGDIGLPEHANAVGVANDAESPILVYDLHVLFAVDTAESLLAAAVPS